MAEPRTDLQFIAGVGYNDAKFDEFGANSGNRIPFAPKFTASAATQFRLRAGEVGSFTLRGECNYRDHYYVQPGNAPSDLVAGYGLVNARVTFASQSERYQAQLWVKNLADKSYLSDRGAPLGGLLGSTSVVYGKPRTYGLKLSARF